MNKKLALLLLIVFTLIPAKVVLGNNNDPVPLFFITSSHTITSPISGDVFVLFGELNVDGTVNGRIFAFFSTIKLNEGYSGNAEIITLSSSIENISGSYVHRSLFPLFLKEDGSGDQVPLWFIQIIIGLTRIFLCIVALALKPSFIGQGCMLLAAEPAKVARNGIIAYFLTLTLSLVFAAGLVLFPVAVVIMGVFWLASVVGQACVALFAGAYFLRKLKVLPSTGSSISTSLGQSSSSSTKINLSIMAGLILTETVLQIPILNLINSILLPIVFVGIVVTAIINGYFKKVFYEFCI